MKIMRIGMDPAGTTGSSSTTKGPITPEEDVAMGSPEDNNTTTVKPTHVVDNDGKREIGEEITVAREGASRENK